RRDAGRRGHPSRTSKPAWAGRSDGSRSWVFLTRSGAGHSWSVQRNGLLVVVRVAVVAVLRGDLELEVGDVLQDYGTEAASRWWSGHVVVGVVVVAVGIAGGRAEGDRVVRLHLEGRMGSRVESDDLDVHDRAEEPEQEARARRDVHRQVARRGGD